MGFMSELAQEADELAARKLLDNLADADLGVKSVAVIRSSLIMFLTEHRTIKEQLEKSGAVHMARLMDEELTIARDLLLIVSK